MKYSFGISNFVEEISSGLIFIGHFIYYLLGTFQIAQMVKIADIIIITV